MSYVALYRKFRPDNFDDVKGQDHIVTTLRNQLLHDRVGHAYLFCGTRGTGKTTMAKLMAKAVNCEHPVNGNPCGECESCQSIASGNSLNVIEIDAASNNGVDNVRQINSAVQYSPSQGKYLVYIIDEVHMMTSSAFNALLKTIEEPPEYVIFILATTEDYKVPVTIRSRCQRYDFRRITVDTIAGRINHILEEEGLEATPEAVRYIARAADGSMRDGLSILDECVSASIGKTLDLDSVLKIVGAVDIDIYVKLMEAIRDDKADQVLDIINDAVWQGKDLTVFTDNFIWFLRNMLFIKVSPQVAGELDITSENVEIIKKLGESFTVDTLSRYIDLLQELSVNIRYSTIKRVSLEMTIIRMMRPESDTDLSSVLSRLDLLEAGRASAPAVTDGEASGAGNYEGGPGFSKEETVEIIHREIEKAINIRMAGMPAVQTQRSEKPKKRLTLEEEARLVEEEIRNSYPEATAEELIKLGKNWKNEIRPNLPGPHNEYLQGSVVVAGESIDGEFPKLKILLKRVEGVDIILDYYKTGRGAENMNDILGDMIKRKVQTEYEIQGGEVLNVTDEMRVLNKLNFDNIEIKD